MEVSHALRREFGDFQTPETLAVECCALLRRLELCPGGILEPTCGYGSFLLAAASTFPGATTALGFDINADYVRAVNESLVNSPAAEKVVVTFGDFFVVNWPQVISSLPEPLLVLGNPPWVTNAALGTLGSNNLPAKSNFQSLSGFDAITGKSNFDISEWMLIKLCELVSSRDAVIAMLCKSATARKVLLHAWKVGIPVTDASIYQINAQEHFSAAVEACFLVMRFEPGRDSSYSCAVYDSLSENAVRISEFGYRDQRLVSDVFTYESSRHLLGSPAPFIWRSGVKHDCSRVMEFTRGADGLMRNGLAEVVDIEEEFLYPMLKSSHVAGSEGSGEDRFMLVPQRSTGDDTSVLAHTAPKTWAYLVSHSEWLDKRGSSIYKKRSRFAVFGIGEYSFSPWKVAISGFYKRLRFRLVGPRNNKPTVLDDTSYFIACQSYDEAVMLREMLHSEPAIRFFMSLVFWDGKRPITADVLNQLDLVRLASEVGCSLPEREAPATPEKKIAFALG